MSVRIGLCGFTISAAAYVKQFPVVEVQQTFYDPPPRTTLEKWRTRAPADFEFTMKAWQVITHAGTSRTYRRLRRPFTEKERGEAGGFRVNDTVMMAWKTTLEACRVLRATAILFQCPASFRETDENIASMRQFFGTITREADVRYLWEPRGTWTDAIIRDVCRDLQLVHVVDPFIRPSLTAGLTYWRLHGNKSHYASYSDAELSQLCEWLPATGTRYVMFNNIPRVKDSKRFKALCPAGHADSLPQR